LSIETLTASNRRTVGRSPEYEISGQGFQGERIPFGVHPICIRLVDGVWGERSLHTSDETAIRFDGVVSMERFIVPVNTPSARGMQRESAASPLPSVLYYKTQLAVRVNSDF